MRVTGLVLLLALLLSSVAMAAPEPQKPSVTAASAIVIDYDTGEVLYEKDADTMRVPASMTKVMTAYIIFEELEAGNLTLDTMAAVMPSRLAVSFIRWTKASSLPEMYSAMTMQLALAEGIRMSRSRVSTDTEDPAVRGTEAG